MVDENDLLPISALQHLLFCERQCALIHIERLWAENRLTIEGQHLHDRAHSGERESRRTHKGRRVRILRSMPLRSLRLGLIGVADVVEMHSPDSASDPDVPFPVEYKRGKPKRGDHDRVQLCAQAMCLEEMLELEIAAGALFYAKMRRRQGVPFTKSLRRKTEQTAERLRAMISDGITPTEMKQPKCQRCSLRDLCMPAATFNRSASGYLRRALAGVRSQSEASSTSDPAG